MWSFIALLFTDRRHVNIDVEFWCCISTIECDMSSYAYFGIEKQKACWWNTNRSAFQDEFIWLFLTSLPISCSARQQLKVSMKYEYFCLISGELWVSTDPTSRLQQGSVMRKGHGETLTPHSWPWSRWDFLSLFRSPVDQIAEESVVNQTNVKILRQRRKVESKTDFSSKTEMYTPSFCPTFVFRWFDNCSQLRMSSTNWQLEALLLFIVMVWSVCLVTFGGL